MDESGAVLRAHCLLVASAKDQGSELRQAFDNRMWRVTVSPPGGVIAPAGESYDLVLFMDPAAAQSDVLRTMHQDRAIVAGIVTAAPPHADKVGLYDVLFCHEITTTRQMRALGKPVHHLAPGPNAAAKCVEVLERHLRYRREPYPPVDWAHISFGHTSISREQVSAGMVKAWQSEEIPPRQRALVQTELAEMYQGRVPVVYQALADAMQPYVREGLSVLEIGCASGYYSEILEYLLSTRLDYTGVDYSEALIRMARSIYPSTPFYVADGARLPFEDERFRVVISSGVLLHVTDFREHIREAARVAKSIVIAHRTPVCRREPTQFQKKLAYGVETVELIFNEEEILDAFRLEGLEQAAALEFIANPAEDSYAVTYVFEKMSDARTILREAV